MDQMWQPASHLALRLTMLVIMAQAFDELLLLKRGGYCIYFGPLGDESTRLVDYFESIPGVPKLQSGINPATWMLDCSTPGAEKHIGADFAHVYLRSDLFRCAFCR